MNKGPFYSLFRAFFFFSFWCFLLVISLFKMAHKRGAEVFVSCPGFLSTRKLRDAFQRKICVRQVLLKYELLCYESKSEAAQSCLTLCDPMDCSLPESSVHGIFQARTLEWVAISFFRGSSQPRDQTQVSLIVGLPHCFTI